MKTFNKVEEILSRHREGLREEYRVKNIGIFGSYVRGEQNKKSDIDILVEFEKPIDFFLFLELIKRGQRSFIDNFLKRFLDYIRLN